MNSESINRVGAAEQDNFSTISFDNTKAGLQSVDKHKTEAIIKQMSEGSSFYVNEERKTQMRKQRLIKLLEKKRIFDKTIKTDRRLYNQVMTKVDALEAELEHKFRLFNKVYVHLDMDMFFAAVEEKKNPALRNVPFGVGGVGMLSTTNYIARQYGVRSGMPGFIGKKLCPELQIVPSDFVAYKEEAEKVRNVAALYDPHFVSLGLDELTMELSGYLRKYCNLSCSRTCCEARAEFTSEHTLRVPSENVQKQKQQENPWEVELCNIEEPLENHWQCREEKCKGCLEEEYPWEQEQEEHNVCESRDNSYTRNSNSYNNNDKCNRKVCIVDKCYTYLEEWYDMADEIVRECRQKVHTLTQLTVSAGIAPTAKLAKIASNVEKPNGQHVLRLFTREDVMRYVGQLPVRKIPGIGRSQEFTLAGLGITTVGEIYASRYCLFHILTYKTFLFLFASSLGLSHDRDDEDSHDSSFCHYDNENRWRRTARANSRSGNGDENSNNNCNVTEYNVHCCNYCRSNSHETENISIDNNNDNYNNIESEGDDAICQHKIQQRNVKGINREGAELVWDDNNLHHCSEQEICAHEIKYVKPEDEIRNRSNENITISCKVNFRECSNELLKREMEMERESERESEKSDNIDDDDDDEEEEEEEEELESWRKSIGQERTFRQLMSSAELEKLAFDILREAHARMVRKAMRCGHLVVKTKERSFHVHQYSKSLPSQTDDLAILERTMQELLIPLLKEYSSFRLFGVRLEKLSKKSISKVKEEGELELRDAINHPLTLTDYFCKQSEECCKREREKENEWYDDDICVVRTITTTTTTIAKKHKQMHNVTEVIDLTNDTEVSEVNVVVHKDIIDLCSLDSKETQCAETSSQLE